jgi:hypothetical protein
MQDNQAFAEQYVALLNQPENIIDNLVSDLLSRDCYSIRKCFSIPRLGKVELNSQDYMRIKKQVTLECVSKYPDYKEVIFRIVASNLDEQLTFLWVEYIDRSNSFYWEFSDWKEIELESNLR